MAAGELSAAIHGGHLMALRRTVWVTLATIALVVGVAVVGHRATAGDAGGAAVVKWEYARLYIGEQEWVLTEAEVELTIHPPGNPLPRQTVKGESSGTRYTADSKTVHNFDVGAMNFAGERGWEAVAITPWGKGQIVLLKRPTP
jgi:hypothetical protein